MTISSENAGKVAMEGKFPCAVCKKCVGINSNLCQFCKCWDIKSKLNEIVSLNAKHV